MPLKIGILCNYSEEGKLSLNQDYITYFDTYGTTVFIDPISDNIKNVDLLVGIGGNDINPMLYGQCYDPYLQISPPNRGYDYFDFAILPKYLDAGIKVFGICRMFQRLAIGVPSAKKGLNITGSLHAHVDDEPHSNYSGQPVHFAGEIDRSNMMMVNSTHHQAVKVLADDLRPLLWSYDAKSVGNKAVPGNRRYIEAFIADNKSCAGVQWHPERGFTDKPMRKAEEFTRSLIHTLLH